MMSDPDMVPVQIEAGTTTKYEVIYFAPGLPKLMSNEEVPKWSVYGTDIEEYYDAIDKAEECHKIYRNVRIHRIERQYKTTRVWMVE